MKILLKDILTVDESGSSRQDVLIEDGIISKLGHSLECDGEVIDGSGLVAMPGLFDMHVHFRDPGLTYKEDIKTGSAAALAGGVTGILCMPNTKPPIDSPEVIDYITKQAEGTGVDVYMTACITKSMSGRELCDYDKLLCDRVPAVTDDGRPVKNAEMMRRALAESVKNGMLVCSHCEDMDIIGKGIINKGEISEKLGVAGMDRASEDSITAREIALAAAEGARIHICHVSTKGSIDFIRAAKSIGIRVTCETCPHYLVYTDEKLLSRDADYRMNPPLRTETDRKAMVKALLDGTIDCIVTDHAPHAAEEKADFEKAPNGVVGLETSLSVMLTYFYHTGRLGLERISALMSANPRRLLGIPVTHIKEGDRADICIIDPEKEWTVIPEKLHSKSKNTVFKGERLKGKVVYTISDGIIKYKSEE